MRKTPCNRTVRKSFERMREKQYRKTIRGKGREVGESHQLIKKRSIVETHTKIRLSNKTVTTTTTSHDVVTPRTFMKDNREYEEETTVTVTTITTTEKEARWVTELADKENAKLQATLSDKLDGKATKLVEEEYTETIEPLKAKHGDWSEGSQHFCRST